MKKSFLSILACITVLLSSCLGDNETTRTGSNEFAVIKQTEAKTLYATSVSNMSLSWDGINEYNVGDAVFLSSYHVSSNNFVGNIVKADYANVSATFPVGNQLTVTTGTADTTTNVTNKIGLADLAVIAHNPWADILNDKWEISYTCNIKEGEVYSLKFVYDAAKQKLKGQDLPANTAIVDVLVEKKAPAIGTTTEKKTQNIVVNFDVLRPFIKPQNITAATAVSIHFRYSKEGSNSTYTNTSALAGQLAYPVSE